jgi:hypothetical protein
VPLPLVSLALVASSVAADLPWPHAAVGPRFALGVEVLSCLVVGVADCVAAEAHCHSPACCGSRLAIMTWTVFYQAPILVWVRRRSSPVMVFCPQHHVSDRGRGGTCMSCGLYTSALAS